MHAFSQYKWEDILQLPITKFNYLVREAHNLTQAESGLTDKDGKWCYQYIDKEIIEAKERASAKEFYKTLAEAKKLKGENK